MVINMTTTTQITASNIIDIHSHLIFDVDDGPSSLEESLRELKEAKKIGISKIICTPHIASAPIEKITKIKNNFIILRDEANKIGIDLFLGTEVLMSNRTTELLEKKRLRSLNGTKYILVEFKRNENKSQDDLINLLTGVIDLGYVPVLAHPEFYINYLNIKFIQKLKELGVILQLDAISVIKSKTKRKTYKFAKKLLKNNYIEIIASDNHCNNRNYKLFYKSYKIVCKKYGCEYANLLYYENPKIILEESKA